jgi:hypothetical protein
VLVIPTASGRRKVIPIQHGPGSPVARLELLGDIGQRLATPDVVWRITQDRSWPTKSRAKPMAWAMPSDSRWCRYVRSSTEIEPVRQELDDIADATAGEDDHRRVMPIPASVCSGIGIIGPSWTGRRCVFVTRVNGSSRVPLPPPGMKPFISTATPQSRFVDDAIV